MPELLEFIPNLRRISQQNADGYTSEQYRVGSADIHLYRPDQDVVASPYDEVVPLQDGQVDLLVRAKEEGPCGGVNMAELVLDRLIAYRATHPDTPVIYGNHPPSKGAERHKGYIEAGVSFTTPMEHVPTGSIWLFSAHGADPREVKRAQDLGLRVINTTCPLVDRVYSHIRRAEKIEDEITPDQTGVMYLAPLYKRDHPEVAGTRGVAKTAGFRFIPVTSHEEAVAAFAPEQGSITTKPIGPEQVTVAGLKRLLVAGLTTNNAREVIALARTVEGLANVCGVQVLPYSEHNVCRTVQYRQDAMTEVVQHPNVSTVLVVGAVASNNTTELVRVAAASFAAGGQSKQQLDIRFANHFSQIPRSINGGVGLLSGASTQQHNVDQMVTFLHPTTQLVVGDADRLDLFTPLGRDSLAARVLRNDFSWLAA